MSARPQVSIKINGHPIPGWTYRVDRDGNVRFSLLGLALVNFFAWRHGIVETDISIRYGSYKTH